MEVIPKTVPEQIEYYCRIYNADCLLATNIGYCESRFDPEAQNPNSTAKGIYQFLDSTWANYCQGDPLNQEDNIKCGVKLISEGGLHHWSESFGCWKYLPYTKTPN